MKMGDKVIVYGYIDGYSYETTGQTNYIIALETGERVEIPLGVAINADEIVFKDNIKLKDVIKRIQGFDDGTKLKWTYDILKELGSDFGSKMFHEGYQQGNFEGAWVGNQLKDADKIRRELNKIKIPQFAADVIESAREHSPELEDALHYTWGNGTKEFTEWYKKKSNRDLFARAWLDGYEVEKEKQYIVSLKNGQPLVKAPLGGNFYFNQNITAGNCKATRKQLEEAGFGWVFDCEGIEVEEVGD